MLLPNLKSLVKSFFGRFVTNGLTLGLRLSPVAGTRALPRASKVDKLAPESMADKQPLQSEGEQLDEILAELQQQHQVKEIAGWETGFANLSRALDGILPGLYLLRDGVRRGQDGVKDETETGSETGSGRPF